VLERVPFADTRCPANQEDIPIYILQILKAVSHCHKHGIIHHDIKEDNILWQPYQKKVKLLDFGLSKVPGMPHTLCSSTPGYLAPEIERNVPCTPKIDCWSIGVILFNMLFSVMPKNNRRIFDFVQFWLPKLLAQPSTFLADVYDVLSGWIKDGSLLQIDDIPPQARQQLHTPAAFELLAGLLDFNPIKRLSPEDAQLSTFFVNCHSYNCWKVYNLIYYLYISNVRFLLVLN